MNRTVAPVDPSGADDAALYRLLVDSVKDYAIFVLDVEGRVRTWNSGAERIKGYTAREIVGRHFSVFYPIADEGRWAAELATARDEGRFEEEGYRVRKDGTQFWASVVLTPLRDASGALIGYAKVTRDLTERVRLERERRRLVRAEETERRKDEFLAIMGHELRNPLAPMVTALHLLKLRSLAGNEKELAVMDRQLKHMMRLVDDLLDVSRMLRGKLQLNRRGVEVAELVAQAVEVARPLAQKKGQELRVEVPAGGLRVHVDADRMVQVFGNLLTNAAKYTGDGGHLKVSAAAVEALVEVVIEDDGVGISADLIPRVFDLFSQGEQGIDRKQGGLGIGLAVARRLVDGHGGELIAESEGEGRGSRFVVRLPRATSALADAGAAASATPALGFALPRRVLIVDDDADNGEMMRSVLAARGHQVRVALDGPQALEMARAEVPSVVFLDLGMPGMDGFEVARRIRQLAGCQAVPLVAVSGYARESDRQQALDAGFSDHLPKPVRAERIIRVAEEAPI